MFKSKRKTFIPFIYLVVSSIIILIPFYFMVQKSFAEKGLKNYADVFTTTKIQINFLNSAVVSLLTITCVLLIALFAAFAFSKLDFRFENLLYLILIMGLMIVPAIVIIPVYKIVLALKLTRTILVLIGPYMGLWFPVSLILIKGFLDDIPGEISDSASIDGCSPFKTLLYIILPIAKPVITAVVVVLFVQSWNEYFYALVMLRREEMRTLTLLPLQFIAQFRYETRLVFAALVVIEIPVVLVFAFLNKYIKAGLVAGAIKG